MLWTEKSTRYIKATYVSVNNPVGRESMPVTHHGRHSIISTETLKCIGI